MNGKLLFSYKTIPTCIKGIQVEGLGLPVSIDYCSPPKRLIIVSLKERFYLTPGTTLFRSFYPRYRDFLRYSNNMLKRRDYTTQVPSEYALLSTIQGITVSQPTTHSNRAFNITIHHQLPT